MSSRSAERTREGPAGFGLLLTSPLVWAAHFLACYLTAAIWCAKAGPPAGGALGWVRAAVVAYTVVALAVIGGAGALGYRHHRSGPGELPHDGGSRAERRRWVGFTTVLLSVLSAIATVYAGLVAAFIGSCR